MMKIDPIIAAELQRCPLPWSLDVRKRNVLVRVAGEVVTKLAIRENKQ